MKRFIVVTTSVLYNVCVCDSLSLSLSLSQAPVITNYETTSPITHYNVQYQLNTVGSTSQTISTPNNATLQIDINGLTVGATYIIKVFSVNTPNGNHNFITKTVQISELSGNGWMDG